MPAGGYQPKWDETLPRNPWWRRVRFIEDPVIERAGQKHDPNKLHGAGLDTFTQRRWRSCDRQRRAASPDGTGRKRGDLSDDDATCATTEVVSAGEPAVVRKKHWIS